jgi:hypothetical protein
MKMTESFSESKELQQLIQTAYRSDWLPSKQQKEALVEMLALEHRRLMRVWQFPGLALGWMAVIVIVLATGVLLMMSGWVVPDTADVRFSLCGLLVLLNMLCVPSASIIIIRSRKWKQN